MTIQVNDIFPDARIHMPTAQSSDPEPIPKTSTTHQEFRGKTVVLVGHPGAYTPESDEHIGSFLQHYDALKAKGVDTVAFLTSNDVFVMHAWGLHLSVGDKIQLLSDGNVDLGKQLGLDMNLRGPGMGDRFRRFVIILKDLKVTYISTEDNGAETVYAEAALANL